MGFNFGAMELMILMGVVFVVAIVPIVIIAGLVYFVTKSAKKSDGK